MWDTKTSENIAVMFPKNVGTERLFCLPYAGGSAAGFRNWSAFLPPHVEVCPVELPGRGVLFSEPPFRTVRDTVDAICEALQPHLACPFRLFGYSMGALIAFEVTRYLQEHGCAQPSQLFVAAVDAPHRALPRPHVSEYSEPDFLEAVRKLNGTPPELLGNPELMNCIGPTLRADFALCENYTWKEGPRLTCPIMALGGAEDSGVSPQQLALWGELTDSRFEYHILPGDHFFIHSSKALMLQYISNQFLI